MASLTVVTDPRHLQNEFGDIIGYQKDPGDQNVYFAGKKVVASSKTITQADFETILSCASAITLTLPNDATLGITDTSYAPSIAIYAAGATVPTLDVSAVTMRGTAPTVAQYGMYGIVRVGANEWAYV